MILDFFVGKFYDVFFCDGINDVFDFVGIYVVVSVDDLLINVFGNGVGVVEG